MREKIVRFISKLLGYELPANQQVHYIKSDNNVKQAYAEVILPAEMGRGVYMPMLANMLLDEILENNAVDVVISKESVNSNKIRVEGVIKYLKDDD